MTARGVLVGKSVAVAATVSKIGVTVNWTPPEYPALVILGAINPINTRPTTTILAPAYITMRAIFLGLLSKDAVL